MARSRHSVTFQTCVALTGLLEAHHDFGGRPEEGHAGMAGHKQL